MTITAFWFFGDKLRDGRPIPPDGEWLEHEGELVPCQSGLHASRCPFDALQYAPGPWLALVECDGEIVEHGDPVDKFCARRRRIVRRIDGTDMLREFARECALSVLRLWDAPALVKEYLETGDEKLRYAARDAAVAARDAVWAAAWVLSDASRSATWASQRKRFRELVKEKFPEWEGVA